VCAVGRFYGLGPGFLHEVCMHTRAQTNLANSVNAMPEQPHLNVPLALIDVYYADVLESAHNVVGNVHHTPTPQPTPTAAHY
jgi:hypothetical protein